MSPLLPTFNEKAKVWRVAYAAPKPEENLSPMEIAKTFTGVVGAVPGNRLTVNLDSVVFEDCEAVESIEEAEDKIFGLVEVHELILHEGNPRGTYVGDAMASVSHASIHLARMANIIAARTRRGAGNKMFMGSALFAELVAKTIPGTFVPTVEKTEGRWTLKAIVNGTISVYVNDSFNEDEIAVAYVGPDNIDGPGAIIKKDDSLGLYVLPNTADALGNAADYISRVRVKIQSI